MTRKITLNNYVRGGLDHIVSHGFHSCKATWWFEPQLVHLWWFFQMQVRWIKLQTAREVEC